jgi:hypothetical protein
LISEFIFGDSLLAELSLAISIDIEGFLIQTLWIIVYSIVKHKKIPTDMHCLNILIRNDQVFQYFDGEKYVGTKRLAMIDYVDIDTENPKNLFDIFFYSLLYIQTFIQKHGRVEEIQKIFKNPFFPYNSFLKDVLECFRGGATISEDILESHTVTARLYRTVYREMRENIKNS